MWATRRAPAGGGARDGDDIVPEPRPSLLYLFNCRIDAPMDGSCLRWCVLHALLLMSPRDRAQLPAHAQLFLNQVLACPSRPAQMTMLCRLCVRSAMNKIDCKIVLEEYVCAATPGLRKPRVQAAPTNFGAAYMRPYAAPNPAGGHWHSTRGLPHSTTAAILCEWAVGAARRQPLSSPNTK